VPVAWLDAGLLRQLAALHPREMTTFDQEYGIEHAANSREAAALLKRDRQSCGIGLNPCSPLAALLIRVRHQGCQLQRDAHSPKTSWIDNGRTIPRLSARTPASITLRSPATTTSAFCGSMYFPAAFCTGSAVTA